MIRDKFGLYHSEEEIQRVISRFKDQLARASTQQQRRALQRIIEQKESLLLSGTYGYGESCKSGN